MPEPPPSFVDSLIPQFPKIHEEFRTNHFISLCGAEFIMASNRPVFILAVMATEIRWWWFKTSSHLSSEKVPLKEGKEKEAIWPHFLEFKIGDEGNRIPGSTTLNFGYSSVNDTRQSQNLFFTADWLLKVLEVEVWRVLNKRLLDRMSGLSVVASQTNLPLTRL
jgi:hypothetical protein